MERFSKKELLLQLAKTAAIFVAATGCAVGISMLGVGSESIIMVFLLGVLFISVLTSSYVYGILASILSLMLFNYLFTEPKLTFVVSSTRDLILLLFFLITAIVSGFIASGLKKQMWLAAKNERTVRTLYEIASGFVSINGTEPIIQRGISYIHDYIGRPCAVRLGETIVAQSQEAETATGKFRDFPIQSVSGKLGSLRIFGETSEKKEMLITAVAMQLGIALSREQLRVEQENIRLAMERERQRSTVLRSVAHDLRSPLTALSGASSLLDENYERLSDMERKKLASDISDETLWLTNLVENILSMTRIGDQQLRLVIEDEVIDDIVSEAVSHTQRLLKDRKFTATLPKTVVMVPVDGRLMVQVIINLLENAVRHTPPEAEISLSVTERNGFVELSVADTGEGIAPEVQSKVFDRFVTLDRGITDSKRGLGLGLAICKAITEAHGGSIRMEQNRPHGAVFTISLPLEVQHGAHEDTGH